MLVLSNVIIALCLTLAHSMSNSLMEDKSSVAKDKLSHYNYFLGQNTETSASTATGGVEESNTIKISSQIEIPNSEGMRLVVEALQVIWEALVKGLMAGFLPTMERVRRETRHDWESSFLLDWLIDMFGAMIGRQRCSQKGACRTGKFMQDKLPGAQMIVIMAETFIPPVALEWFGVVRQSVINRSDSCVEEYQCDFSEEE